MKTVRADILLLKISTVLKQLRLSYSTIERNIFTDNLVVVSSDTMMASLLTNHLAPQFNIKVILCVTLLANKDKRSQV